MPRLPQWDYWIYFRQLVRHYGWKAFSKQFRFSYRRPFSRGLIRTYAPEGMGLEVGVGSFTIAPTHRTVLTDGFESHASSQSMAQIFCPSDRLPFSDQAFHFVLSEHVLEHLSDPVSSLLEWRRVLKSGGILFLFLPHAQRTFDRFRSRTPLQHLLEDHEQHQEGKPNAQKTSSTLAHLREWKEQVIDRGLAPHYAATPIERHAEMGLMHHHVWWTADAIELLQYLGFRILEAFDQVPDRQDSFCVIAENP